MDDRAVLRALRVCFLVSGATGLAYELTWFRRLGIVFGGAPVALAAVLVAFMGGLAAGAAILGRRADRAPSPIRLYAFLEAGIGGYALVFPMLLAGVQGAAGAVLGALEPGSAGAAGVKLAGAVAVMAVPTALMGATLPALARHVRALPSGDVRLAELYALNTLGGVLGTLATGFFLLPSLGVLGTERAAAAVNLALALAALAIAARASVQPSEGAGAFGSRPPAGPWATLRRGPAPPAGPLANQGEGPVPARLALLAVFCSGLASMVFEVAWHRLLTLVVGSTVYAAAAMLAVFLLGIALGGFEGARRLRDGARPGRLLAAAAASSGALAFLGLFLANSLPTLYFFLFRTLAGLPGGPFAVDFLACGTLILPPAFALGLGFPAALAAVPRPRSVGRGVGRVVAWNTLGAVLGSILASFLFLRSAGIFGAILAGAVLLLGSAAVVLAGGERGPRRLAALPLVAAAALAPSAIPAADRTFLSSGVYRFAPDYRRAGEPPGSIRRKVHETFGLLEYREGFTSSVAVLRTRGPRGDVLLHINGKADASLRSDLATELILGHLPLLFRGGRTRSVLVVGYGSGITVGAVLSHRIPGVVCVELERAVLEVAPHFFAGSGIEDPRRDARFRMVEADAREFLVRHSGTWDVIVSEPSNPWIPGSANLFTREAFEACHRRLAPGGIHCQWLHLYNMDPGSLRALLRTFSDVYGECGLFQDDTDVFLLGSDRPIRLPLGPALERARIPSVAASLGRDPGLGGVAGIVARYRLDRKAIRAFAGEGPRNTDDNALVEFSLPGVLEAPGLRARNVEALLEAAGGTDPAGLLDESGAEPGALSAFYEAVSDRIEEMGRHYPQPGALARFEEAFLRRRLALGPTAPLRHRLARVLGARGDAAAAAGELALALRLDPGYAPALLDLAEIESRDGAGAAALDLLDRAAAAGGEPRRTAYLRAGALLRAGRAGEALRSLAPFRTPSEPESGAGRVGYLRATILRALGRFPEARAVLDEYLLARPDDREAASLRRALGPGSPAAP